MILYFRSGTDHLNVCFEKKNYNCNSYPEGNYIDVDPEALDAICQELLDNDFDYVDNLKMDKYQKQMEACRRKKVKEIVERINNGELLTEQHSKNPNTGKRYPNNVKVQRDIIYATMLAYPKCNNSEIARMTGASRGTVIKCRKDIENYTDITNCANDVNHTIEHL